MTTLVVGATGATGRLLVEQLLQRRQHVRIIVRSPDKLAEHIRSHANLSIIAASILELGDDEFARHVNGCHAVASCLGHNLSLKGIWGNPRRLVTDTTARLCTAIMANRSETPVRFVLMNTAGNSNRDLHEPITFAHRCVVGLIRLLVPPHADNEQAADHLRTVIGPGNRAIQWVVVRPDSLVDQRQVSEYDVHPSPTRSAIFNAGSTSRINVAHFMARLILEDDDWNKWKGRMPVIYNRAPP